MTDISKVTDYLYIGAWNSGLNIDFLNELGINLVISAIFYYPYSLVRSDIDLMWLPTFDSSYLPIPVKFLDLAAQKASDYIEADQKVLVYCKEGRHRSVAMASAILINNGYSSTEAIELIKARRADADPDIWYIKGRIEAYERYNISRRKG